jgi:transposase
MKRRGAKRKDLSDDDLPYVTDKVSQGWTPDVIIGRGERQLNMSSKTLYRRFKDDERLNILKGKRKPNGHQETRGKHSSTRSIHSRKDSYSQFDTEFGYLEGDTIVGKKHKSAIITLKPDGRTAKAVGHRMSQFLAHCPHHLFKSITFDCGKNFLTGKVCLTTLTLIFSLLILAVQGSVD